MLLLSSLFKSFIKLSELSNIEELHDLYHPYVGQKKIIQSDKLQILKNYLSNINRGEYKDEINIKTNFKGCT